MKASTSISSYFIETLSPPNKNNWHHRGVPITLKINFFSLNPNHRLSLEHIWKTLMSCIQKGLKYTGKKETKSIVDLTLFFLPLK